MRAVQGDLISRYSQRRFMDASIIDPDGGFQSFDLIVMCVSHATLDDISLLLQTLIKRGGRAHSWR